jgi:antirestriction protein ArdC
MARYDFQRLNLFSYGEFNMARANIYKEVTSKIVAAMKTGTPPWVRPWSTTVGSGKSRMQPHNMMSDRPYHGINAVLLMMVGSMYPTGAWATYNQIKKAGGQVRKGERSTQVVYYGKIEVEDRNDPDKTKRIMLLRFFSVFNHAQADWEEGKDPLRTKGTKEDSSGDDGGAPDCEATLKATGATIVHGGNVAAYIPSQDRIQMPPRKAFKIRDEYYSTAFHELTHWTGVESRCDRKFGERFADSKYAFEELVAELGSAFLCAEHNIDATLRHAAYLSYWIKCLEDDDQAIFKAAALAQKAANFILPKVVEEEEEEREAA